MANFFDKIGNYINEAVVNASNANIYRQLASWHAIDKPVAGYQTNQVGKPKKSLEIQAANSLFTRNMNFDKIDYLQRSHLASSIKEIIISEGFCELGNNSSITVKYTDDENKEKAKMFNESIQRMLKRTKFLDILEECIVNEGMSYSEIFLTTKFERGRGLVRVDDDLDIREHIALYRNTDFVGALEFKIEGKNNAVGKKFINPEFISHFMLNYEKIPVKLAKNFVEKYKLPEKIRVAKPLLLDVVELILQYDILEKLSSAIEINQATQPIFMGIGISPDQDMGEISRNLQEWSNVLNKNKNNVINSLETLDVSQLLQYMQQIELVPYSQDEGTNTMRQIQVNYKDSNLTDKINNLRKIIAQAVGIPESYLATMTYQGAKDTKEDALHTNPRFSRMLTKIQQLIAKGIRDVIYKHLKFQYSNAEGVCTRKIDKDNIEVLFDSATNLNSRLENENMILNAQAMSDLLGMVDGVATSQNIHVKVETKNFLNLWKKEFAKLPEVRDIFVEMTEEEIEEQQNRMYGDVDDYEDIEDAPPPNANVPLPNDEENPLKRNKQENGATVEEIGNGSQTGRISNIL
jgi:hypothetical protein